MKSGADSPIRNVTISGRRIHDCVLVANMRLKVKRTLMPFDELRVLVDVPVDNRALNLLAKRNDLQFRIVKDIAEDGPIVRERTLINDIDVVFCTYPPANLGDMSRLRLVQIASSGYSQLCGLDLPSHGIRACNARGVFDTAIAEWNIAMMINLARHASEMYRNQQGQLWDRAAKFQTEIRGSIVGLWGYGGIARQTARLCKALGLTVYVLTRSPIKPREDVYSVADSGDPLGVLPDQVFSLEQQHDFLCNLDFLVLCMPLTRETEGSVGVEQLSSLPQRAFLLNPARGPLVSETALIAALRQKQIAGAALDTHYYYPMPQSHPLWFFENVLLTPHISGSSDSPFFKRRIWEIFTENIDRLKNGGTLLNELSPAQLAGT